MRKKPREIQLPTHSVMMHEYLDIRLECLSQIYPTSRNNACHCVRKSTGQIE